MIRLHSEFHVEQYELEQQSVGRKKVNICTPGTQSVRKMRFLGVPADAENRVLQFRRSRRVNPFFVGQSKMKI